MGAYEDWGTDRIGYSPALLWLRVAESRRPLIDPCSLRVETARRAVGIMSGFERAVTLSSKTGTMVNR